MNLPLLPTGDGGAPVEAGGRSSSGQPDRPLDVIVSVVTVGEPERLKACLAALPAAAGGLSWTCRVVDNTESGDMGEVTEAHGADRIRVGRRQGFSQNHNLVLR